MPTTDSDAAPLRSAYVILQSRPQRTDLLAARGPGQVRAWPTPWHGAGTGIVPRRPLGPVLVRTDHAAREKIRFEIRGHARH